MRIVSMTTSVLKTAYGKTGGGRLDKAATKCSPRPSKHCNQGTGVRIGLIENQCRRLYSYRRETAPEGSHAEGCDPVSHPGNRGVFVCLGSAGDRNRWSAAEQWWFFFAKRGSSRPYRYGMDGVFGKQAGTHAGGDSGHIARRSRAGPRHDPGAAAWREAGVHGRSGGDERKPGLHRKQAAGFAFV